jgi:hypothetical protein
MRKLTLRGEKTLFALRLRRRSLSDWLRYAVKWKAKKLNVKLVGMMPVLEQRGGSQERRRSFLELLKRMGVEKSIRPELEFVSEEDGIWEWEPGMVKEAAEDPREEMKVIENVTEQLTKDGKSNSLAASNQTLKTRVQSLREAAERHRGGGKHGLDNPARVVKRLQHTCGSLTEDLLRVQVSNHLPTAVGMLLQMFSTLSFR